MLGLIPSELINKVVDKHQTDKHSKGIDTRTHLVSMVFMQLSDSTSLRDIANGLLSAEGNLNHFGITRAPAKSSLSYLNKNRNYEVFKDIFYELLNRLCSEITPMRQYAKQIKRKISILDSTTITLCLDLFDWAKYQTSKGAIKLHTVLDYDSGLPSYAVLSDGKQSDITAARAMNFASNSILVMDRGYVDYEWLADLDSRGIHFVTRLKSNANIEIMEKYLTDDKDEHILSDEDIRLSSLKGQKAYPKNLRIVKVYDEKNDQTLILLTNNMSWTANTVSQLYKARWAIESFFKQLKQLFKIKTFVGFSENAVQIQIWCSLIAILLITYIKNKAKYAWHLSNLVSFLRLHLFVKTDLWKWANNPIQKKEKIPDKCVQLALNFP